MAHEILDDVKKLNQNIRHPSAKLKEYVMMLFNLLLACKLVITYYLEGGDSGFSNSIWFILVGVQCLMALYMISNIWRWQSIFDAFEDNKNTLGIWRVEDIQSGGCFVNAVVAIWIIAFLSYLVTLIVNPDNFYNINHMMNVVLYLCVGPAQVWFFYTVDRNAFTIITELKRIKAAEKNA